MANKITDLTILDEFENEGVIYGLYWCKFEGKFKAFTRNGNTIQVLMHFWGKDVLCVIRNDVKQELLEAIEKAKEA